MLALGLGLVFVSLPLVILLFYGIITGGHILGFLIPTVMLLIPALFLLFFGTREPKEKTVRISKSLERRVLQLAAVNDGELTAAKLALGSQLRVDECQRVLEQFEAMGVAHGHIGAQGEMRYTFPQLQESLAEDDDFMRRLNEEDPHAVLDFDLDEIDEDVFSQVPIERRDDE